MIERGGNVLASWRQRSRPPARSWVAAELLVAAAIITAGLEGYIPFSSTPWLLAVAAVLLWWRGPGFHGIGLRRPSSAAGALIIGTVVGVAYQFIGLYVVEPAIARMTSGELPDASAFRSLVGDEMRLAFFLAMSWSVAAFMEEAVYRGWLMTRLAELGRFSTGAWISGVLGSSVLFGVIHAYQGLSGMIATGLTGLVFACVYLATGRNLWPSIVAHGVLDTVGFVMIYFGVYPGLSKT